MLPQNFCTAVSYDDDATTSGVMDAFVIDAGSVHVRMNLPSASCRLLR